MNVTSRWEAVFSDQNPAGGTDRTVVAAEDNVFFILGKTVVSLTGEVVELPFTSFDMQLQTVKDEFLYFAYRPSTTAWHDIFRVREDGSGLEQLASGLERIESFDVDPTTETIYYTGGINTVTRSHFQNLYTLDFGDSTPTLICEDCAWDVDFVADDEWFQSGDTDLDHDIDITDFNGLSDNFAPSGYAGPFDVPGVSAIPEPSTVVLLLLSLGCVMHSARNCLQRIRSWG